MTDQPDPLPSTWASRDLPILASALRRLDVGETFPNLEEIRAEVGLDVEPMRAGLDALEGAFPPYLTTQRTMSGPSMVGGFLTSVSERVRRELGTWPSPATVLDALVAALTEAAEAEPEPEKRSRLSAAAQALSGMAREVAVRVIAAKLGGL